MPALTTKEKLLQLVDEEPEEKLGRLASSKEELKKPMKKKIPEKYKAIYEGMGKFKDSMSSSEEFSKRKQEEKLLDK